MGKRTKPLLEKCTIIVSSCDKYEELWEPFFGLLQNAWEDIPCAIVLNTETKQYTDKVLDVNCINTRPSTKKKGWGGRLKDVLRQIETEYVLFMLDDFFVDGQIDSAKIEKCIEWMEQDNSISVFSFMETFGKKYDDKKYPGFERRKIVADYKFNCQAAVWRRKHLMQYLRSNESPWEWEIYGNWRSYRFFWRKFYSRDENTEQIIPYIFDAGGRAHGGLVLVGGKWYLPLIEYFESKYGIRFDRSMHEVMTKEEFDARCHSSVSDDTRAAWKKYLWFLRRPYHVILKVKNVLTHIKYVF